MTHVLLCLFIIHFAFFHHLNLDMHEGLYKRLIFPFGNSSGDLILSKEDDGFSSFELNELFVFYNRFHFTVLSHKFLARILMSMQCMPRLAQVCDHVPVHIRLYFIG